VGVLTGICILVTTLFLTKEEQRLRIPLLNLCLDLVVLQNDGSEHKRFMCKRR
jgi:hypothetical protein